MILPKRRMGDTVARVDVRPLTGRRSAKVDFLVDTGSTYTWVPANTLQELGIVPVRRGEFETVEGRTLSRRLGHAVLEYGGRRTPTIVVFGRRGDAQVLGVVALEGLGYAVDPVRKRMRKLRSVLAV